MRDMSNFSAVFYGDLSTAQRGHIMLSALTLGLELKEWPAEAILNLSMMLAVLALNMMDTDKPDQIMADLGDCTVRSYAASQAYVKEALEEEKGGK